MDSKPIVGSVYRAPTLTRPPSPPSTVRVVEVVSVALLLGSLLAVVGLVAAAHAVGWPVPFSYDAGDSNHGPWRHFYFARDALPLAVLGGLLGAVGVAVAAIRRPAWGTITVAVLSWAWLAWLAGFCMTMCD